jgi:hypothetical protein
MGKQSSLTGSRLYCSIQTYKDEVFFSLWIIATHVLLAKTPNKIIEFYESFKNRDDLIEWMKERPKSVANIYEVDGDKEIVVVIPTADFKGKYAKECRENIFKGLHIVFVESGGREDFYFNYAHNCNVGIKKAMEYGPKWIVVSNDDMEKIDDISLLVEELGKDNFSETMTVYTSHSDYHFVGKERAALYKVASFLAYLFKGSLITHKILYTIRKRYGHPIRGYKKFPFIGLLFENYTVYRLSWDFAIFSSLFVKSRNGVLYDETFINGIEDYDVFSEIYRTGKFSEINFKIASIGAASFGHSLQRTLRESAGFIYFDEKRKGLQDWSQG